MVQPSTITIEHSVAGDQESMVQTEDVPHKPAKRPRPSMAPRLLAGGDALRKATPGTAASSHDAPALPTAGRDQRGWAAPPQATWGRHTMRRSA